MAGLYQPGARRARGLIRAGAAAVLSLGLAACSTVSLPAIPLKVPDLTAFFGPPSLGLDQVDQERASDAAEAALSSGSDEGWSNAASGHRGEFHPGPAYARDGETCRDFTHAIYKPGSAIPYEITGTACRPPGGGGWRVVS